MKEWPWLDLKDIDSIDVYVDESLDNISAKLDENIREIAGMGKKTISGVKSGGNSIIPK